MTKVRIGEKYSGPAWDRPALRRLPLGWELTLEEDEPPALVQGLWAVAALLGAWVVCVVGFTFF